MSIKSMVNTFSSYLDLVCLIEDSVEYPDAIFKATHERGLNLTETASVQALYDQYGSSGTVENLICLVDELE